jgi:methionyl-tRNA formyltransferase
MMQENNVPVQLNFIKNPASRILFLGYSQKETILIKKLIDANCEVFHTSHKIKKIAGFDLVVSYGYRHILPEIIIQSSSAPIINLHASYLPWNRGAYPNFWAHYDQTPSGVSIHLIDEGIDTGPIIYQKMLFFDTKKITFIQSYNYLKSELEFLFIDNIDNIIRNNFIATPQILQGTHHNKLDLPADFLGWDKIISEEILRLKNSYP